MAKLSDEILEQGRERIRAQDLEGFMSWVQKHAPNINAVTVKDTYSTIFKAQNTEKGLKLFEAVFPEVDPEKDARVTLLALGILVLVLLGSLGGVVYLFQSCSGS